MVGYSTSTGERESRPFRDEQWHLFIHVLHALCTADMLTPVHGQESSTCWSSTLRRRRRRRSRPCIVDCRLTRTPTPRPQ